MPRKITFTEVPSSKGWEVFLKGMKVGNPAIFKNVGNVVINGRQAIKRYNKKIKTGKLEPRKFETKTYSDDNTFTITKIS